MIVKKCDRCIAHLDKIYLILLFQLDEKLYCHFFGNLRTDKSTEFTSYAEMHQKCAWIISENRHWYVPMEIHNLFSKI